MLLGRAKSVKLWRRSVLTNREIHHESSAGTWTALDSNGTTMCLHRVFHDRQTETGTARVPRPVFVNAIKALKNMRLVAQGNTNAIVTYADNDSRPVAASLHGHSGS